MESKFDDHVTIPVCLYTGESKFLIGEIRYLNDGDRVLVKTNADNTFYIERGVVHRIDYDEHERRIFTAIGRVA